MRYTIGIDLGTSFIKISLFDAQTNATVETITVPDTEMHIAKPEESYAEQDPDDWWSTIEAGLIALLGKHPEKSNAIGAIGIAYQMHGLVLIDSERKCIRPSILWCDSRAYATGNAAASALGEEHCFETYLNKPGNFTLSKLAWIKENEPKTYSSIYKILLPGDYIVLKLSNQVTTTAQALSEAVAWNFLNNTPAYDLLRHWNIDKNLLPVIVPAFTDTISVSNDMALRLGIPADVKITYRAGDQPNNAFSLNVNLPGELAVTAGTSGVIYAVTEKNSVDIKERINTFLHVIPENSYSNKGVLLCINGAGISYAACKKQFEKFLPGLSYNQMNEMAATIDAGSEKLLYYPFINGLERMFGGRKVKSGFLLQDPQSPAHAFRAVLEGVAFAMKYGLDIMIESGIVPEVFKAAHANLFLSEVFCEIFVNTCNLPLLLYETDGAIGAAMGAALGAKIYTSSEQLFAAMHYIKKIEPTPETVRRYNLLYLNWKSQLQIIP